MSILDNLIIEYHDNGNLRIVYEIDHNGMQHGISVIWDYNGIIREECYYSKGMRHGTYRDWYPNGQVWEENTQFFGQLHGRRKLWYDNGNILIDSFHVNDKIHGLYLRYYKDGTIDDVEFYDHGVDITDKVCKIVNNIQRITETEKTQIALQFGILI